jgi:Domain of unknown function (DUF4389)
VEAHPIHVVVTDDLRRSRLTVFFRLLLAIPHFIWLLLWSVAAFFAAIASWFATLLRGVSPRGLHSFLAAYVRYTTHFYAYVYLTANPYPAFTGAPGYPIDVEIDEPARQNRWKAAFRLLLALPACFLAAALGNGLGGGGGATQSDGGEDSFAFASGAGVLLTVAFLAWFACLVRGRMPRGFRDLGAYVLRYGAQALGYVLLLTDRYPDAGPADPPPQPVPSHAVRVAVADDGRRSRLTVFFRLLLALPHFVWLALWALLAVLLVVPAWLVALVLGRLPEPLHRFYSALVRYGAHVGAFFYIVANPFPGFTGTPGYPVDIEIDGPERQGRWGIAFRALLAIPALLVTGALGGALALVGIFGWVVGLILGRMPLGLRDLGAYTIRYASQTYAYVLLVTPRYPDSGPLQGGPGEDEAPMFEPAPALVP